MHVIFECRIIPTFDFYLLDDQRLAQQDELYDRPTKNDVRFGALEAKEGCPVSNTHEPTLGDIQGG